MIDLEKLLKEKYELEVLIQDKLNKFQNKYDTALKGIIWTGAEREENKDHCKLNVELKVEL